MTNVGMRFSELSEGDPADWTREKQTHNRITMAPLADSNVGKLFSGWFRIYITLLYSLYCPVICFLLWVNVMREKIYPFIKSGLKAKLIYLSFRKWHNNVNNTSAKQFSIRFDHLTQTYIDFVECFDCLKLALPTIEKHSYKECF